MTFKQIERVIKAAESLAKSFKLYCELQQSATAKAMQLVDKQIELQEKLVREI